MDCFLKWMVFVLWNATKLQRVTQQTTTGQQRNVAIWALHDQNCISVHLPGRPTIVKKKKTRAYFFPCLALSFVLSKSQFKFCRRKNRFFFFFFSSWWISCQNWKNMLGQCFSVNLFMNVRVLCANLAHKFQIQHWHEANFSFYISVLKLFVKCSNFSMSARKYQCI